MITISLCMIVKNEEAVLARCLDCVRGIADEIVVVDTGSTDRTREIAREYTDRVYDFAWVDDFAAARNYSFSKATCDYILWLDADDVLLGADAEKLRALKEDFPADCDVAMLKYNIAFDADGNPTFTYFRERLVRRAGGYYWLEPVHEHLVISGAKTENFDIAVTHGEKERGVSTRNLDIYEKRRAAGDVFSPRATYYYARELRTHGRLGDAIREYRAFLATPGIWLEDAIWASADLSDCLVARGEEDDALDALFLSFTRDLPRAEILCRIGGIYMRREDLAKAAFWYSFALEVPRPDGWGFVSEDHWGFIPHIQLCVLCDRMGEREKAIKHHEAAKRLKPSDRSVLLNERYFYGS